MKPVIRNSQEIPLEKTTDYYKHEFICTNCSALNVMWIRKGRRIKDCVMEECINCGVYHKF